MKSRITIEVDFENGNLPVIHIKCDKESPDVRDKLLKHFIELLGHESSYLKIKQVDSGSTASYYHIHPIQPQELHKTATEIQGNLSPKTKKQ